MPSQVPISILTEARLSCFEKFCFKNFAIRGEEVVIEVRRKPDARKSTVSPIFSKKQRAWL